MSQLAQKLNELLVHAKAIENAALDQHWDLFETLAAHYQQEWPVFEKLLEEQNEKIAAIDMHLQKGAALAAKYQEQLGEMLLQLRAGKKAADKYK